jgi:hypothetical protein
VAVGDRYDIGMGIYDIVVEGRLSQTAVEVTGMEFLRWEHGCTHMRAHNFDDTRVEVLFDLLHERGISLVSVNELLSI